MREQLRRGEGETGTCQNVREVLQSGTVDERAGQDGGEKEYEGQEQPGTSLSHLRHISITTIEEIRLEKNV